jgi:predicted molibdopterin-dependent oxidoreductase YjgC
MAVDPPGDTKPDWQIICELAQKMGSDSFNYRTAENIFNEIAELTPIYHGITYQRLESTEPLHWPSPSPDHPGTPYLHKDTFMRGKGRFSPVGFLEPAELADDEYPFSLTTGRIIFQIPHRYGLPPFSETRTGGAGSIH